MKINSSFFISVFKCVFFVLALSLFSCTSEDDEASTPKPRAYFRITFPEKKYVKYDSVCPFTFEIPTYSKMENDKTPNAEPCWLNLTFPSLNGTLHLSYKPVNGNAKALFEDTYTLASKHQIKASGIEEHLFNNDSLKVYGLMYEIEGNAASSVQFYLTDSTKHFLRGALYFNSVPNIDSIAPVIEFVKKDIYHLIETFRWK
jgi:gliding motility-associated lipoprotein GldD